MLPKAETGVVVVVEVKRIHKNLGAAIKVGIYTFKRIVNHKETFEEIVGLKDELTGILNEKAFWQNVRDLREGCCMVLLDVDNFKQYNDTHGHSYGDRILKRIASLMRRTMPDKVIAHRLHGDEFLLLCKDLESAQKASRIIRRNTRASDDVTVSQGICRIKDRVSIDEAFEMADKALYRSKELGRDRITLYWEPAMVTF